jgi:hypothetical protein
MTKDKIYHEDNVFPFSMGMETKLREVLEILSEDKALKLFDGEEFIDPAELLSSTKEDEDFSELRVRYDEFGIFDFFVKSDEPIFSYALPCPHCGKYVEILSKKDSKAEDFCGCKK